MYGILDVSVIDEQTGKEKRRYKFHNQIVDSGTSLITRYLSISNENDAVVGITHMLIGTSSTATTDAMTSLQAQVENVEAPAIPLPNTPSRAQVQFYTSDDDLPNAEGADNYKEFGFFSEDVMFARVVNATGVNKVLGEAINWQYTINVTKS